MYVRVATLNTLFRFIISSSLWHVRQTLVWNCPVAVELRIVYRLDVMQIMAIVAGGGILIACRHRLAVDRLPVHRLLVMTLDAFGNDNPLVLFPVAVRVDVGVAIGAVDILLNMHTGVMLGVFLFVAPFATDLLHFYFTLHVPGKVGKLDMAAVAAVLAVNGSDKGSGGYFVPVAAEAGGRIDGHALLSPKRVSGKKNDQDHEASHGKAFSTCGSSGKTKKLSPAHDRGSCVATIF